MEKFNHFTPMEKVCKNSTISHQWKRFRRKILRRRIFRSKKIPGGRPFFAGVYFVRMILCQIILRYYNSSLEYLRRIILRPVDSLLYNSSLRLFFREGGIFFAEAFFAQMILQRNFLRLDDYSRIILRSDNFSLG
jgi:hypothetical protein